MRTQIPEVILNLIQKPPLLKGEDPELYYEFFQSVAQDMQPGDIMEWLWITQFVNCAWEALRVRRFRTVLLQERTKPALLAVVRSTMFSTQEAIGPQEFNRRSGVVKASAKTWSEDPSEYEKNNVDPDLVPTMAILKSAEDLEKLDRLIQNAEQRCDTVILQVDSRRAVFASRARKTAARILDAKVVESSGSKPRVLEGTPKQDETEASAVVPNGRGDHPGPNRIEPDGSVETGAGPPP